MNTRANSPLFRCFGSFLLVAALALAAGCDPGPTDSRLPV
ncbi:MAG: hypothetical protein UZ07_CHB004003325, partial [Chlorobi bacterium OLB7]